MLKKYIMLINISNMLTLVAVHKKKKRQICKDPLVALMRASTT